MDLLKTDGDGNLQVLWEDGECVVCRGWRLELHGNRSAVLAVLPVGEHPSPAILARLRHEYELKDDLDSAWTTRPLALEYQHGRIMLVLEDSGGEPLARLLGVRMELGSFLRLAIGIATALAAVHHRGLVHKDLKPANILVNAGSGEVRLTGFGIASRLSRERQAPEPPETIAGTLAYMAPEQTGRMNRSVDARSDLYTLGVTFYQMLTGHLPFTASDPMEWVHCQIARRPMPPRERAGSVPGPVSAIVMKLLAKTAEERYQTAGGVERDLRRCLTEWESRCRIDDFPLGQQDTPDRLLIPEKLYGRTREIETLLAAFDRVVKSGAPELVLVSGYSGIGKSSVVHELHKALVPARGLFASGKFDQYKRDIPYSTLVQAFQGLVRSLLGKSEAELGNWRKMLLEALGPNARLMTDLVTELALIIGEQPLVAELGAQDAQRRFQLVFRRFINVFTTPEHPLALFLDDLQWLDSATLDLLEDLLTQADVQHLLLIGAYRDNEVDAAHPLRRKLEAIRNAGGKVAEITLAPLAHEHLGQLLVDALRCERQHAEPLTHLVHEKTAGNPFFVIQFLRALAEEQLLAFDRDASCWIWDLEQIRAKGYTDNVVDLMVGKLTRLPAETQKALQLLACLGDVGEITMLAIVLGASAEQVDGALWEAVRQELIERRDDTYRFIHDRIQEAAYSLIPQASRAADHLRIGRLLAAQTPSAQREEAIFEIVNQLNRGATLITARDEREHLAELNLIAGQRAKASAAYASALTYLTAGAALLAEDCWERCHELSFALDSDRAECEFLTGELAEAEQRLNMLSARAAGTVERATVTCLRVDLYTALDQSSRAIAVGLDYLRHLGIDWSLHPTEEEARPEYERIWSQIGSRMIESLIELPLMTDPASLATMGVLTKLEPPASHTDANLLLLVTCRAVNLSLERGNCDASCIAYVRLSKTAGARFGDYQTLYRFGQLGHDLVETRGLTRFQARTYMDFAYGVLPWTRHVRTGRDLLRRAFEVANTTGDLTYAAYCGNQLNTNLLMAGDPLAEVQREAEHGLAFAQKAQFRFVVDRIATQLGLIRTLRGLTPTFGSFDDVQFDEARIERRYSENPDLAYFEFLYWVRKLQARFFSGDYESAIDASLKAQRLFWTSGPQLETAEYHFYGALSQAAFCNSAAAGERQQHLDAVTAHHKQLQLWADNCPENFANRAVLVAAEIARLEGREFDAERLYEHAIRLARANGFVHNEALANELAARFYSTHGFEKITHTYLRDARYLYLRWGADGKVRQLDQLYPRLSEQEPAPGPTSTIGAPIENLDLATVLKVSQAVSGEIVLEKLLDTLMRTAIEQAGAERGLLIVSEGTEPRIAAEATTDDDTIVVHLREQPVTTTALPEAIVQTVLRTQETMILDDATAEPTFATDPYIHRRRARSILCLPLLNQSKLIGVLYLENSLAPRVFTPARTSVLRLVASQAAIALENTRLYQALAEREAKIRRLVDANIIGIFVWKYEGSVLEANDAFLRIIGYDRKDLLAGRLRWTDLTPPEWRDRHDRLWTPEIRMRGSVSPYEKEYFRKDGGRVPVLVGATSFNATGSEGVSFVLDLTERKRAEQRLVAQHAVTRILAEVATVEEATPNMLQALCDCLGWDLGALWRIDQPAGVLRCAELWRRESVEAVQFEAATRASTFRPGSGLPGRVWTSRKPEWIPDVTQDPNFPRASVAAREGLRAAFAFPILLGGEVLGVIDFVSRDIRQPDQDLLDMMAAIGSQIGQFIERKRAEQALHQAQAELAHVTRLMTMGELTASIAHEVGQPLGAIALRAGAGLRWLSREPPHLDEVRECLKAAIRDSHRAADIIARVRSLIKKSPPVKDSLDLNEVIQEVLAIVTLEARRHAVLVQTDLADPLPSVRGDRVQLQQVILNLAINGIDAMKEVADRPRKLWIRSCLNDAGTVLVGVEDTGIGLAAESVERVFEAFYTTKAEGMGVGLSISRSIIEAHGGRLRASANAGHGVTFQFTLPTEDMDGRDTAEVGTGAGLAA